MQVNAINFENQILDRNGSGTKTEEKYGKTGFLGIALDKAGVLQQNTASNIFYNKRGSETGQGECQKTEITDKQDMLNYINQNIDRLKSLVTSEDYSAMSELGLAPDKETPDTLVTVYERIQIQLAAYCDDYEGGTISINSDKLKKVLGSEAMAQSVKMANDSKNINDDAKAYLLKNEKEPSIENVYWAVHSTQTGSDTATVMLSEEEWNHLTPQIMELMQKSGMEVSEESMGRARWLMERQIPVTPEHLIELDELNHVDMQNQEVLQSNIAFALMLGMNGTEAFVTENWIHMSEIQEAEDALEQVSDETIYDIIEDGAVFNVANIRRYQTLGNEQNGQDKEKQRNYDNIAYVKAKNVVVEARLMMTTTTFLNMQKVGINITFTDISVMLSEAEVQNQEYYGAFFSEENAATAQQTNTVSSLMEVMKSMSQIPSAVLGAVYSEQISFTIGDIYDESNRYSASYSRAEITYEAVGTQVRRDLGDNISKAFESIDGILEELGLEANESSRRAARILAYNQMEMSTENVFKMESMVGELDYVRDQMTPKTAAFLVEHHIDIMNTDIRELNENLARLNDMIGAEEDEEFAKYLWKLEKSGNITKEDRDNYVDLYRTLNMVESLDSSAVGAVAATGAEFTLNNLLSSVKSRYKTGMDVRVDDTFGFLDGENETSVSGNEDITKFVKKLSERIKSGLNAENVEKVYKNGSYGEISLGNLVDIVSDNDSLRANRQLNAEYIQHIMDSMGETFSEGITEDTVLSLLEGNLPATMENIMSAMELSTPGSEFRKYLMNHEKTHLSEDTLLEKFESEENAKEAIRDLKQDITEEISGNVIDLSYEKVKAMSDISKNIRFMEKCAENESYHIPMEIDGEAVSVRVTFIHEKNAGNVTVSMNTENYGKLECTIQAFSTVAGIKLDAVVYCEKTELERHMEENRQIFVNHISSLEETETFSMEIVSGMKKNGRNAGKGSWRNNLLQGAEGGDMDRTESSYLYRTAKCFLKSVKECLEINR